MGEQIYHVERVKLAVPFYIAWANKVGLVDVVNLKWLFKIRVLNAFGNVRVFF